MLPPQAGSIAGWSGLAGPLTGIYDPTGTGRVLFAFLAAMAETERENIRDATLEGRNVAARKGHHGGRPPVITDGMLHTVLRRRARGEPVASIRPDLIIPVGKRKGGTRAWPASTGRSPSTKSGSRTPSPSTKPMPTSPLSRPAPAQPARPTASPDLGNGVGTEDLGHRMLTHMETALPAGLTHDAAAYLGVEADDVCRPEGAARCDWKTWGVPRQSTVSCPAGHPGGCSSTTTAPTAARP